MANKVFGVCSGESVGKYWADPEGSCQIDSDEFNNFLANPKSPLLVAGDLIRLCQVGQCDPVRLC
jgi:hypothetical protein